MTAFFAKVFSRRKGEDKDKDTPSSSTSAKHRASVPSLLEGKFEAISPTVSPSVERFSEATKHTRGQEKEKDKGLGLLRAVSRSKSPTRGAVKRQEDVPHLTLNLPGPKEDARGRALGAVFEAGPDELMLLDEKSLRERRLTPLETLLLVRECSQIITTRGLETLGLMHPHWHSESSTVQQKLISLFVQSLAPKTPITILAPTPTAVLAAFESELGYARDLHDVAAVLRWGLRHLHLNGDSFGKDMNSEFGWYDTFAKSEREQSYPPKAFVDLLVPQLPTAHAELLQAMLDVITSLAAHSEMNSSSGNKLSMFLGLYLLCGGGLVGTIQNWQALYEKWDRAGRALEHIFLSYIRSQSVVEKLPRRLRELVAGYPYAPSSTSSESVYTRPRFSTRSYDALYIRVNTEVYSDDAKPQGLHPLLIVTDALKSDLSESGEYRAAWEDIRQAAAVIIGSENDETPTEGYTLLSQVFTDETLRSLSMRQLDGAETASPTITMFTPAPHHMRKRSSSVGSHPNGRRKSNANGGSSTVPSPIKLGKARDTGPPSPIASDWNLFSTTGFGEPTAQSLHLASTLLDNEIEKTEPIRPPAVSRKSSSKRNILPAHSRRSSLDHVTVPSRKTSPVKPISTVSTADTIVQLDEAFVDFWNDALLDPTSSSWPAFAVCQLKQTATFRVGDKQITWLVIEQTFSIPPPPTTPVSPTSVQLSPRPSLRSQVGSEKRPVSRLSSTLSATRQRFHFFGTHHESSSSIETTKESRKAGKSARIGEMGEIIQEEASVPQTTPEPTTVEAKEILSTQAHADPVTAVTESVTAAVAEDIPSADADAAQPVEKASEVTATETLNDTAAAPEDEPAAVAVMVSQESGPAAEGTREPQSEVPEQAAAIKDVLFEASKAEETMTLVTVESQAASGVNDEPSESPTTTTTTTTEDAVLFIKEEKPANTISTNRGADGSRFIEHIPTPPEYTTSDIAGVPPILGHDEESTTPVVSQETAIQTAELTDPEVATPTINIETSAQAVNPDTPDAAEVPVVAEIHLEHLATKVQSAAPAEEISGTTSELETIVAPDLDVPEAVQGVTSQQFVQTKSADKLTSEKENVSESATFETASVLEEPVQTATADLMVTAGLTPVVEVEHIEFASPPPAHEDDAVPAAMSIELASTSIEETAPALEPAPATDDSFVLGSNVEAVETHHIPAIPSADVVESIEAVEVVAQEHGALDSKPADLSAESSDYIQVSYSPADPTAPIPPSPEADQELPSTVVSAAVVNLPTEEELAHASTEDVDTMMSEPAEVQHAVAIESTDVATSGGASDPEEMPSSEAGIAVERHPKSVEAVQHEAVENVHSEIVADANQETVAAVAPEVVATEPESIEPLRAEIVEPVQPEIVKAEQPETVEVVRSEAVEALQPEIVEAMQSEIVETEQLEIVETMKPDIAEHVQPKVIEAGQPETDALQPETVEAVQSETVETEQLEIVESAKVDIAEVVQPEVITVVQPEVIEAEPIETVVGRQVANVIDAQGEISEGTAADVEQAANAEDSQVESANSAQPEIVETTTTAVAEQQTVSDGADIRPADAVVAEAVAEDEPVIYAGEQPNTEDVQVGTVEDVKTESAKDELAKHFSGEQEEIVMALPEQLTINIPPEVGDDTAEMPAAEPAEKAEAVEDVPADFVSAGEVGTEKVADTHAEADQGVQMEATEDESGEAPISEQTPSVGTVPMDAAECVQTDAIPDELVALAAGEPTLNAEDSRLETVASEPFEAATDEQTTINDAREEPTESVQAVHDEATKTAAPGHATSAEDEQVEFVERESTEAAVVVNIGEEAEGTAYVKPEAVEGHLADSIRDEGESDKLTASIQLVAESSPPQDERVDTPVEGSEVKDDVHPASDADADIVTPPTMDLQPPDSPSQSPLIAEDQDAAAESKTETTGQDSSS